MLRKYCYIRTHAVGVSTERVRVLLFHPFSHRCKPATVQYSTGPSAQPASRPAPHRPHTVSTAPAPCKCKGAKKATRRSPCRDHHLTPPPPHTHTLTLDARASFSDAQARAASTDTIHEGRPAVAPPPFHKPKRRHLHPRPARPSSRCHAITCRRLNGRAEP